MVGNYFCQAFSPQTCWVVGQTNQINFNKEWLTFHDFEQYSIGPLISYRGIPKIPEADYPIIEKDYSIIFYDYYGVKYISIRKRPIPIPASNPASQATRSYNEPLQRKLR